MGRKPQKGLKEERVTKNTYEIEIRLGKRADQGEVQETRWLKGKRRGVLDR